MQGYALRGGHVKTGQFTVPTGTSTVIATVPSNGQGAYGGGVSIRALSTNTASIYVGGSGVTVGNGFFLGAGDSLYLAVDDPSRIYAISGTAAQGLCWIGL